MTFFTVKKCIKCRFMGMREFPLRVLVNPSARVLDSRQVVGREGWCSMHGYSVLVQWADKVEALALEGEGRDVHWEAEGWPSRLVQHKLDHLEWKMFLDRMQAELLYFNYWKTVNIYIIYIYCIYNSNYYCT